MLELPDGRSLADAAPLHYAPSGTVYVELLGWRSSATVGSPCLAMGDPCFPVPGGGERGAYMPVRKAFGALQDTGGQVQFARLPFSGLEASAVGDALGTNCAVRVGALATEKQLRARAPGSRVLHIATHGLLDPLSPLDSALILGAGNSDAPEEDGYLRACEIMNMRLDGADLVALSACETAQGKLVSGEGIVGLSRAFMTAGARSVLCSQWSVADESTAALMSRFYTHYQTGAPKDVALQQAMREIRSGKLADGSPLVLPEGFSGWSAEWSKPFYWAPFVLVGDYRPN